MYNIRERKRIRRGRRERRYVTLMATWIVLLAGQTKGMCICWYNEKQDVN
jgi:hypothetical protein